MIKGDEIGLSNNPIKSNFNKLDKIELNCSIFIYFSNFHFQARLINYRNGKPRQFGKSYEKNFTIFFSSLKHETSAMRQGYLNNGRQGVKLQENIQEETKLFYSTVAIT